MSILIRYSKDITTHLVALRREIEIENEEEMTIEQSCLLRDVCKALGLDETFTMIVLGERNYHLVGWPENEVA